MKTALCVSLLVLAVGAGFATSQTPGGPDLATKVDALEKDLVGTRQKLEDVTRELQETRTQCAQVLVYLDNQARQATTMKETLDQAEAAGFTKGINYESREILLRGWRVQLDALQQNVPALPAPKPADAPARKTSESAR